MITKPADVHTPELVLQFPELWRKVRPHIRPQLDADNQGRYPVSTSTCPEDVQAEALACEVPCADWACLRPMHPFRRDGAGINMYVTGPESDGHGNCRGGGAIAAANWFKLDLGKQDPRDKGRPIQLNLYDTHPVQNEDDGEPV
jgi:hypothetical protein